MLSIAKVKLLDIPIYIIERFSGISTKSSCNVLYISWFSVEAIYLIIIQSYISFRGEELFTNYTWLDIFIFPRSARVIKIGFEP